MLGNDTLLLGLLWLLSRGKKSPAAAAAAPGKGAPENPVIAASDAGKLMARANQQPAQKWVTIFQSAGMTEPESRALARWAGIESSGNPLAISPGGERGLLQVSRTTALVENAITEKEWNDIAAKATPSSQHAAIGAKLVAWLYNRAAKHVQNVPPVDDVLGKLWLAKLYHQRPVDVRDAGIVGPDMKEAARALAFKWATDAKKMHYLRAANIIAWGTPEP